MHRLRQLDVVIAAHEVFLAARPRVCRQHFAFTQQIDERLNPPPERHPICLQRLDRVFDRLGQRLDHRALVGGQLGGVARHETGAVAQTVAQTVGDAVMRPVEPRPGVIEFKPVRQARQPRRLTDEQAQEVIAHLLVVKQDLEQLRRHRVSHAARKDQQEPVIHVFVGVDAQRAQHMRRVLDVQLVDEHGHRTHAP